MAVVPDAGQRLLWRNLQSQAGGFRNSVRDAVCAPRRAAARAWPLPRAYRAPQRECRRSFTAEAPRSPGLRLSWDWNAIVGDDIIESATLTLEEIRAGRTAWDLHHPRKEKGTYYCCNCCCLSFHHHCYRSSRWRNVALWRGVSRLTSRARRATPTGTTRPAGSPTSGRAAQVPGGAVSRRERCRSGGLLLLACAIPHAGRTAERVLRASPRKKRSWLFLRKAPRVHQINLAITSNFACVIKVTPPRLGK